jgi:two-component system CheB/CheR fusion protein
MFGQAAVGIAHMDFDGRLVRLNQRMAALAGRSVAEMQDGSCAALVHHDDWPVLATALAELGAGRRSEFSADTRWVRPDGRPVWVHVTLSPLAGDDGPPEGLIAIVEEVHERRTAEERARLSEERARAALDVARLGTWSWKEGAAEVDADERAREIGGLPVTGPVTFADALSRIHPDDRPRVRAALANAFDAGSLYVEEFRIAHDDGSLRWVVARGRVVSASEAATGGTRLMVGSLLDITEQRLAEDALKLADRQKDDFLALLSHELRNPLAPIRTAVHLLKLRHAPDADSQRLHGVIERQVQHLVHLVDDLLDVSRVLRDKIELRPQTLALSDVVALAAETTRPTFDAHRQRLEIALPDTPTFVRGDQVRLSQVLGNLLHNASKFSHRGATVWLAVERDATDHVLIRVRDGGAGMAPELLPTIFEPFVQADRSLERSQGGLGIGLTLVKKIIDLHGGSVTATSPGVGHGSEFIVRLPADAAPASADRADDAPSARALRPGLHVLVVDDNADAAESLAALLRSSGQIVRVAYNGPDAVAAAVAHRPDVVLLDIGLPGMNGYEVASALRRQPGGGLALVAITGYGQDTDARRAAEAGFDRHLVKPVDPGQLERVLAAVVA